MIIFNIKKILKTLFLSLLCLNSINAQDILTLENAMKIALMNNYEIKIAATNLKINNANVSIGNAGILPSVAASIVDNNSLLNTSQTRLDGTSVNLNNAKNNSLVYGIGLDWTIFDGLKMFAKYDQLKQLEKLGHIQLEKTILSKISDVNSIYYDLVQQQQQISDLDSTIVISKRRVEFTQNRYTIGKGSKLDVLNAKVDLNTDLGNLLRQKQTYANSKTLINQILARDLKIDFIVIYKIIVDRKLKLNELTIMAEKQNPDLITQIINKKVSELQLKQIKGDRYPIIKLNTGYNFNSTQSSLGFTTQSSSKGLNYGFTASLNLFNGNSQKRNEKIAKMNIENSNFVIEQQKILLNTELTNSFQTYKINLELIDLEEENVSISKQNLDITAEKFRIGTITSVEFRIAQLNSINAKSRLSNALYQAKLSEITLRELAGTLNF